MLFRSDSLVKDIITPPLGVIIGGLDFSNYFAVLKGDGTFATLADAQKAGAVTLNYGLFVNAILKFLIVAAALFLVVRQINRLTGPAPAEAAPATPEDILLLRDIRDSLKAKG